MKPQANTRLASNIRALVEEELTSIVGGMRKDDFDPSHGVELPDGIGGSSWGKDGIYGLAPRYAVDGSPAPVWPFKS